MRTIVIVLEIVLALFAAFVFSVEREEEPVRVVRERPAGTSDPGATSVDATARAPDTTPASEER